MRKSTRTMLALAATVSLTAAACGSDSNDADDVPVTVAEQTDDTADTSVDEDAMDEEAMDEEAMDEEAMDEDVMDEEAMDEEVMAEEAAAGAPAVDDGASTLRAGLTSLLQEHVYLAGVAIETALDDGGDLEAPATAAAVAALDENSVALSEAVGSVAGPENGEAFLGLWREHIGFFVDYTLGRATDDQAAVDQALTDLSGYQQAAGDFFEEITGGNLPADALVGNLDMHISTLTAAIDSLVAGDAAAFGQLREAAQHMDSSAQALSSAIVAAVPDMFPGSIDSAPAETRAVLTNLLQEHTYLAGIALEQAIEAGGDLENPAVVAAVETLDVNSVALAEVIGSVAGPDNQEAFLGLWREHIGFFVDYTLGQATGDQAAVDQALTDLSGYQQAAGDFFETITGGEIQADALVAGLETHVETVTAAIDSFVAGDPAGFSQLRAAGQHMPMAALAIATGVVAATS